MSSTPPENEEFLDPKLREQLQRELYDTDATYSKPKSLFGEGTANMSTGMLVIGGSMFGLVGMQLPFLFIKHAPYMATPGRKIRDALQFLDRNKRTSMIQSTQTQTTPRTFVDLGSGDGQAVYEAARLGYHAVGIEFNYTLWAFSSLRRQFFWPKEVRRRSTFLRQDFTNYNLKDANTIMIFAVPRTMPILGRKIQSECSPGTNVMSYRFKMPLANSIASQTDDEATTKEDFHPVADDGGDHDDESNPDDEDLQLRATCIYDQEEMRIYRMGE